MSTKTDLGPFCHDCVSFHADAESKTCKACQKDHSHPNYFPAAEVAAFTPGGP